MRRIKNAAATVLRMLGVAIVLALIILIVEVIAGVFLVEVDELFG